MQTIQAGCLTNLERSTDYKLYLSHPKKDVIDRRIKIISFKEKYGMEATLDAFEVGRSTVYLWQQKLKDSGGELLSLAPKSRAPINKRKKDLRDGRLMFLLEYRKKHPGVNQHVIKPHLDIYCAENSIPEISARTIARRIADLKEKKHLREDINVSFNGRSGKIHERQRKKKKKKRRGKYKPSKPGDLVQMDTIERFDFGLKRYIITAIDQVTRITFAYSYTSKTSANSKDFLEKLRKVMPFDIKRIQTDNGSEFMKHFDSYIEKNNLTHFFNYPRKPQMNAYIERFNGVIQSQFVDHNSSELDNLDFFNSLLIDYLLWYNTEKIHLSLDKQTPMNYYINKFLLKRKKSPICIGTGHRFDKWENKWHNLFKY